MNFSEKVILFNKQLHFEGELPPGFRVLNPYLTNPETRQAMEAFYRRFYADQQQRRFLIGINPSRHGAGVTGVPFTDTKRLKQACGIPMHSRHTHEISSVFMYDMIDAYGGVESFYRDFYINSPFPLAIIRKSPQGNWLNANYYDDRQLFAAVKNFMIETLRRHISFGLNTEKVYVLGKKNAYFLLQLNKQEKLFEELVALEHPRYIQQYRSRDRGIFIQKYLDAFKPSS